MLDDIKEKFFSIALEELERNEKYMTQENKVKIAEFRWNIFVENFVNSKEVHNYAVGNWTN